MAQITNLRIEGLIAKGTHSAVKLGRSIDTLEACAMKEFVLDGPNAQRNEDLFNSELEMLKRLPDHRNLPRLRGYQLQQYLQPRKAFVVLEYLPFPSLSHYISENGPLPEENALFVLFQLLDVALCMQGSDTAHRDFKPDNIIINPDTLLLKVIDFGLASEIIDEHGMSSAHVGTPFYMAPEVLNGAPRFHVYTADAWSIGVIFLEMLLGRNPWGDDIKDKAMLKAVQRRPPSFKPFSPIVQTLLKGLLSYTPPQRFSFADAMDVLSVYYDDKKRLDQACAPNSYVGLKSGNGNGGTSPRSPSPRKHLFGSTERERPPSPMRARAYSIGKTRSLQPLKISPRLVEKETPNNSILSSSINRV